MRLDIGEFAVVKLASPARLKELHAIEVMQVWVILSLPASIATNGYTSFRGIAMGNCYPSVDRPQKGRAMPSQALTDRVRLCYFATRIRADF